MDSSASTRACALSVSVLSHSVEETRCFGTEIGHAAEAGDTLCLSGELGAGKTTLAQGIARGLQISRRITSPTFTLLQEYSGRLRLYHLDCYRLGGPDDLEPLGADEWLGRDGLTVIEWPERVVAALPDDRLEIRLQPLGDERLIELVGTGHRSRCLAEAATQAWRVAGSPGSNTSQ